LESFGLNISPAELNKFIQKQGDDEKRVDEPTGSKPLEKTKIVRAAGFK